MRKCQTAKLHNAESLPLDEMPCCALSDFQRTLLAAVEEGSRVAALFACGQEGALRLVAVLARDKEGKLEGLSCPVEGGFPSITPACPQAHLFEREIHEQYGLAVEGHPWLKPVRYHAPWGGPAVAGGAETAPIGLTDYFRIEGEEIHEVAVGPVHAGVIEPGHFRFQCHGENVFHLEISLGYQYRGVEQALLGGPHRKDSHLMEVVAGDTTIGHGLAYCQMLEALAGVEAPGRAQALRGIALELERLANHTGDLGALALDVGYLPTASYCGRIRGDFLNMTALVCGSRFGRGWLVPGGVHFDLEDLRCQQLVERLQAAAKDVAGAVKLLWAEPTVRARFERMGELKEEEALQLGIVGVPARASHLMRDVRKNFPSGIYRTRDIPVMIETSGSVFDRAMVRWLELEQSLEFILALLEQLPEGEISAPLPALPANRFAVSLCEGWRGEICHVAMTDAEGKFLRYKIVDPSFHNWTGLAMALRDMQISDFPLANKSFNLSYCGHDL